MYDNLGLPRSQPLLWGNTNIYSADLHGEKNKDGIVIGPAEGWDSYGPPINTVFKFPVGSDPDDMNAMQTTYMSNMPNENVIASPVVFDPSDDGIFYCFLDNTTPNNGFLSKWKLLYST